MEYVCTQGGDWLSASPIHCHPDVGGAAASPEQGRFIAIESPMSQGAAEQYCRQNHAALASLHSFAEQQQAYDACHAMATDEAGTTVAAEASNGGYGCWIGFQRLSDDAATAGFAWTDGSSVTAKLQCRSLRNGSQ